MTEYYMDQVVMSAMVKQFNIHSTQYTPTM